MNAYSEFNKQSQIMHVQTVKDRLGRYDANLSNVLGLISDKARTHHDFTKCFDPSVQVVEEGCTQAAMRSTLQN